IRRLQRVRDLIAAYNGRVATTAAAIAEMQKTLAVTALADAEADYRRLLATSNRYSEPTFSICDRYLELLRVREDAVKAKELAREALGRYTADFLPKYEASINANLARLGVDFQIVQTKERHDGGTPSVDYRLQLCKSIVPLTPDKKNPICAHFANTLSSGDKAALAFAFFLTALQAQGLAGRIIVFDDPVSSLDCFRRQATCQELRRLGSEAAQLLLLSHDAFFLRHVWADFPKESKRTLCVLRSGDESIIEPWDIEQMVQGTYEQDHLLLTRYMTEGKCHDLRMIARCIRPFLEAHLRYRCPGHFEGLWLGEMIRSIRESTDEPLLGLQRLLQELSDTNEYSAPFHHDQNADWANHPVTDGELKTYVTRALALRGL
ncbi:MAG: AAA family ATPase, partial [Armatimonadota bacterium]